jgi:hypothetical protein
MLRYGKFPPPKLPTCNPLTLRLPHFTQKLTVRQKTPFFDFSEAERGKTLYAAACRQNEKGRKGQWSDIAKAIIP